MSLPRQHFRLTEARTAIEDGNYKIAVEILSSLLSELDDQNLLRDAFALLGVCRGYQGDDDEAIRAFSNSIEIGMSTRHFEFLPYRFFCDMEDLILLSCDDNFIRSGYGYPYDDDDTRLNVKGLVEESFRRGEKRTPTWEEQEQIARSAVRKTETNLDIEAALGAIADGEYETGIEVLRDLAADQNSKAAYQLACLLASDVDDPANEEEAISLLNQAADDGLIEAQMKLSYLLGDDDRDCYDPELSAHWAFIAAQAGDSNGQLQFALKLMSGKGVEADYFEAADWLEQSSSSGNERAKFLLALLLYEGQGVDRDRPAAGKLWLECAKLGMPQAAYHLGMMCMQGHRFIESFEPGIFENEVDYWLRKAAMNGYPEAQYLLGVEKLRGEQLPRDVQSAYRWLVNAKANGIHQAGQAIEQLRAEIGDDMLAKLDEHTSPTILWAGWPPRDQSSSEF